MCLSSVFIRTNGPYTVSYTVACTVPYMTAHRNDIPYFITSKTTTKNDEASCTCIMAHRGSAEEETGIINTVVLRRHTVLVLSRLAQHSIVLMTTGIRYGINSQ